MHRRFISAKGLRLVSFATIVVLAFAAGSAFIALGGPAPVTYYAA